MRMVAPHRHVRRAARCLTIIAGALLAWGLARAADAPPSAPSTVPAFRQAQHVAVLTIEGEIDGVTRRSLERRLEQAQRAGAEAIVLEINTPGGEVLATRDICHFIKQDCPPNTVAWINPNAYSAGTYIALACREIVVAPDAAFGDAAPVTIVPLPQAEREKQESPLRAEVVDSARRNHYDENLVQAFVSVGIELWLIEHVSTGERVFVNREEYRTVFGEDPPDKIPSFAPPADRSANPVRHWHDTTFSREQQLVDQSSGLSEEEIREQIEFQQTLPPSRAPLTEADRGRWRLVTQVVRNDQLLALKASEGLYYGLAVAVIANDEQLKQFMGASTITRYDRSWSESLVRVLVSWPVKIVLIVVFVLGLFIELAAPGFGIFGTTAAVALLLLLGAPYLAGAAQWWDVLLVLVGLVLVAAEILVIPGTGLPGMAGAACLLIGIVGTFVTGDLSSPQGQQELWTGVLSTLTALFASAVGVWLISRQIHTFPIINRLMLNADVGGRRTGETVLEAMGPGPQRALAPGDIGSAATDLRPAGRAEFDGRLVDVQTQGRYIDRGTAVRVTSVGKYVIEVEEAE